MKKTTCYRNLRIGFEFLDPDSPIEELPPPKEVILPLLTRNQREARQLVERGEEVFTGERIAEHPKGAVSTIHASITGRYTDTRHHRFTEYGVVPCMVIQSSGKDTLKTYLRPMNV